MSITVIYGVCLFAGLIYTVIAFLLGGIGDAAHGDAGGADGSFTHDYGVGDAGGQGTAIGAATEGGQVLFGPFSPMVIAFFLTCFGGVGLITQLATNKIYVSLPVAALSGFILAWLLIKLFNRVLGSMQVSSEVRLNTLIGADAEVTVAIPATGIGEIAYVAMGSRYVAPARSEEQAPVPRYAAVRITRIVGNMFFVRPQLEDQMRTLEPAAPTAGTEPRE